MRKLANYAAIAVLDSDEDKNTVIETISIVENEVSLSGLWVLSAQQHEELDSICSNKLTIKLKKFNKKLLIDSREVAISDLCTEAKKENLMALGLWQDFKDLEPVKRKKLVQPDFFEWPDDIELNNAEEHLGGFNRIPNLSAVTSNVLPVLTAAYLIQFLLQKWQQDEQERMQRPFIRTTTAGFRIIPESWMF